MQLFKIKYILSLTTCSSSVLELSSGIVSGKTVSLGDDTQLPLEITKHSLIIYYTMEIFFIFFLKITSSSVVFVGSTLTLIWAGIPGYCSEEKEALALWLRGLSAANPSSVLCCPRTEQIKAMLVSVYWLNKIDWPDYLLPIKTSPNCKWLPLTNLFHSILGLGFTWAVKHNVSGCL